MAISLAGVSLGAVGDDWFNWGEWSTNEEKEKAELQARENCGSGTYYDPLYGGCVPIPSSTTTPKPATKPSTSGGGYVAPKPSTTPTTPVDVPESSGISGMKMLAIGMALAAVGLVVAKKKGYLRNSYEG